MVADSFRCWSVVWAVLCMTAMQTTALHAQESAGSSQSAPASSSAASNDKEREYARLAEMLRSGELREQVEAVEALEKVRPSDVADANTRKLIARGYRNLAMDKAAVHREEAIRGLVVWGGKFSVPILVEIIDKEQAKATEELFTALAELKDPKGAEAVARQLGNVFNHKDAVAALRKMGSAAEDALQRAAPSNNAVVSLAAVQLLGDVGGEKSIALLQQAATSRNPEVKAAASESLKRIRERKKNGVPVDPPAEDPNSPFAGRSGRPAETKALEPNSAAKFGDSPAIVVSAKTTYITEPLKPNGLPDYEKYALKLSRGDVKSENNAAVLLWQAMWPGEISPEDFDRFSREIGLPKVPLETAAIRPLYGKANTNRIVSWLREQGQANAAPHQADELIDNAIEQPWTAKAFPPLAAWTHESSESLDLILSASERPQFYSPSPSYLNNKEEPLIEALLPGGRMIRDAAQSLAIRAMGSVGDGRLNEAWRDILAIHRLARLEAQGTVTEQMMALTVNHIACRATVALLANDALSVELARLIHRDLLSLKEFDSFAGSLDTWERLIYLDSVLALKDGNIEGWQGVFHLSQSIVTVTRLPADWNVILNRGNEFYDRIVAAARLPRGPGRKASLDKLKSDLDQMFTDAKAGLKGILGMSPQQRGELFSSLTLNLFTADIDIVLKQQDDANTLIALTRLAAAVAIYRAEHHGYPATLDALAPGAIDKVPVDAFSGKPFVYKRVGNGFLLYSVGENGRDDGGSNKNLKMFEGESYDDALHRPSVQAGADDIGIRTPRPPLDLQTILSGTR
jgi:hypothetical protein